MITIRSCIEPLASRENYSLLIMGVNNGDGDGGGVDGDGSRGTSPSRQGAGTETYIPRISSLVLRAVELFMEF